MRKTLQLLTLLGAIAMGPVASAHEYTITFSNSSLIERARGMVLEGNVAEARKAYDVALARDLSDQQKAQVHNGLCVSFIIDEKWDEALKHCNLAIRIVPNNWRFYNNRGNIYLQTGELDKAMDEYNTALKLAPQSYIIKKNMALADLWITNGRNTDVRGITQPT